LGDYVWFIAKRGRIDVREKLKVVGMTISINEEGEEQVTAQLDLARDHYQSLRNFRDQVRKALKKK
jgi:hypothetical protein